MRKQRRRYVPEFLYAPDFARFLHLYCIGTLLKHPASLLRRRRMSLFIHPFGCLYHPPIWSTAQIVDPGPRPLAAHLRSLTPWFRPVSGLLAPASTKPSFLRGLTPACTYSETDRQTRSGGSSPSPPTIVLLPFFAWYWYLRT